MILLCDDTELHREATAALLRSRGYAVRTCATAREALSELIARPPRVLILDLIMPEGNGADLLAELARRGRNGMAVIVTTAMPDPLPEFPCDVHLLRKPFAVEELATAIEQLAPLEKEGR